jgi:tetratricopeptide (TPR) repeat protein
LAFRSGDYPWSSSLLESAGNQMPNNGTVQYQLALADYAVGRATEAETAMQKAVQSGDLPELDKAKQFLTLLAAAKSPTQARALGAQVQEILAKEPNNVPALMVSALSAQQAGQGNEAIQAWQKTLTIYPLFAPAMREMAIYYAQSQNASDRDKAYMLAQKARESMPDDLELAKTLGFLAYGHAEYDRSRSLLSECTDKFNKDGELFYYLGMDYYKLKQRRDSKQALQHALEVGVADNLAGQARTVLKEMN